MKKNNRYFLIAFLMLCSASVFAEALPVDTLDFEEQNLDEIQVVSRRKGITRMGGAVNGQLINQTELFRAACCNLGESFVTNPSVDVNYSDAATGAQQIKLLGLSGTYVQMLTENMPNFTGAAAPFALDYVPGPWMKSIQVSKGAASVKNGANAMTGQINIQYLQPEDEEQLDINLYGNSDKQTEMNLTGNHHFTDRLSTVVLLHGDKTFEQCDENDDGFMDDPDKWQVNVANRWAYLGDRYIFHGGASYLKEERMNGQMASCVPAGMRQYTIGINTERAEAYMKHAFVFNKEQGKNLALMASLSSHNTDAHYGDKRYDVRQRTLFAQLMYECNYGSHHNLAVGADAKMEWFNTRWNLTGNASDMVTNHWNSGSDYMTDDCGLYAQYTYNLNDWLILMGGLHTTEAIFGDVGDILLPRLHAKIAPWEWVELRLSAGSGRRTSHFLQENHYLLASGRELKLNQDSSDPDWDIETSWNYGASLAFNIPLFGRNLKLNADYYYTRFTRQVVADYECNPKFIVVRSLSSGMGDESFSHCLQVDANYTLFKGFDMTAAFRRNISRVSTGGQMYRRGGYGPTVEDRLFTPKYKGLLSLSYKPGLGLWQFDATLQLNGPSRLPSNMMYGGYYSEDVAYKVPENEVWYIGETRYSPTFCQLTAQITREFRHFSVYVGGENLTGYTQKNPILGWENPWSGGFDATQVWGPIAGAMFYGGIRIKM